jgi:hypothetical protein
MKLSECIHRLQELQAQYGDVELETRDGDAGQGYGGSDLVIEYDEKRKVVLVWSLSCDRHP